MPSYKARTGPDPHHYTGRPRHLPPAGSPDEVTGLAAGIATVHRVETDQKLVALTFDDGPDPTHTPAKVHALTESGAAATFFVLGSLVEKYPYLAQQILAGGGELANHSFDHPDLTGLGYSGVLSQLDRTKQAIAAATGAPPATTGLFRPPYGFFDSDVLSAAADSGHRFNVLWDVDPSDYRRPYPDALASRVLAEVAPGSIVVLHDWVPETAQALPGILAALAARRFRAVTVSELLRHAAPPAPPPPAEPEPPPPGRPQPGPGEPSPGPGQCRTLEVRTPMLSGDDVAAVQEALSRLGHDPGPVDGLYGPLTAAAVERFQREEGLPATGVVMAEEYRRLGISCPS